MIKDKKKFMRRSIVFMSLVVVMVLVLNSVYIFYAYKTWNFYRIQREYADLLDEEKPYIKYAFFGDSHAEQTIDQKHFPEAFNFAVSSENYVETYYKFNRIIDDGVEVENIVLEIDLHTFSKPRERLFINPLISVKAIPVLEMARLKNESAVTLAIKSYLPVFGIGLRFVEFTEPKTDDFTELNMTHETLKVFEGHFETGGLAFEEPNYEYFLKLLVLAEENDVNVIFMKYPLTKDYDDLVVANNYSKGNYYTRILWDAEKRLDEYVLLDYYDVFFDHPEYFYDPHHVNDKGRELMSHSFYADLEST